MVDVNSTAQQSHENAVQQAQQWAQEARTQRAIVLSILRFFGLPERDWEALTLIQEKDSQMRAAMLKARAALAQATTSETFYRDPRGDNAGPAIDALEAELRTCGVNPGEAPSMTTDKPAPHASVPMVADVGATFAIGVDLPDGAKNG